MWEVEHGPRGGDELNLLKAGANYGWPLATHGIDYGGRRSARQKPARHGGSDAGLGAVDLALRALLLYRRQVPGLEGFAFIGALSAYALFRIELDGERYRGEERLIADRLPYIRDVRQGPDGLLYLVTHSDDGGLFRLEPA